MAMKKRMIAATLCLCMAVGLMPTAAYAEGDDKNIMLKTSVLSTNVNTVNAVTVYFSKDNSDQPGAWRVIGYGGEGVI